MRPLVNHSAGALWQLTGEGPAVNVSTSGDSTDVWDFNDYVHNPFRLTGLPVDATARQIRRRTEELKAAAQLGADDPRPVGFLAPQVSPQVALDAIRRLGDPVARLRFEFGWLWPVPSGGAGGSTLKEAWSAWTGMLEDGPAAKAIALHNMAIVEHVRAAESPKTLHDINGWSTAYRDWRRASHLEEGWRWLEDRVAAINDPRLQKAHVTALRDGLPGSLIRFHATTVIAAAGDNPNALGKHRSIILQAGFDTDTVGRALADSVEPQIARLRTLLHRSRDVASRPQGYRRYGEELLAEISGRDLETIRILLTADHPAASGVIDQLALTIRSCVVGEINHPDSKNTDNYRRAVENLDRASEIPIGPHAAATIAEDVKTLLGNLVHHAHIDTLNASKDRPGKGLSEYHRLTGATAEPLRRLREMDGSLAATLAGEVDFTRATVLAEYLVHTKDTGETLPLMRILRGETGDDRVRSMLDDFIRKADALDDAAPTNPARASRPSNLKRLTSTTVDHGPAQCSVCDFTTHQSRQVVIRHARRARYDIVMLAMCDSHITKSLSLRGFSPLIKLSFLVLAVGVLAWMAGWDGLVDPSTVITGSAWTAGLLILFTVPRRFRRLAIYGNRDMQQMLTEGWRLYA